MDTDEISEALFALVTIGILVWSVVQAILGDYTQAIYLAIVWVGLKSYSGRE